MRWVWLASEAVLYDIVPAGPWGRFWAPLAPMPTPDPTHTAGNPSLWCVGWIKSGLRRPSLFSSRPAFQLSKLHFVCCVNRCLYEASSSGSLLEAPALIWIEEEAFTSWVGNRDTRTPRAISQSSVRLTPLVLNESSHTLPFRSRSHIVTPHSV